MWSGRPQSQPTTKDSDDTKKDSKSLTRARKFLADGDEPLKRLRALREYCDTATDAAQAEVFTKNFNKIYEVVFDSFCHLEANIRNRQLKSQPTDTKRADVDMVIFVLRRLLHLLPDLIHKGWLRTSIPILIEKLLAHANTQSLRCDAFILLLEWLVALGDRIGREAIRLFRGAICLINLMPSSTQIVIQQKPIIPSNGIILFPSEERTFETVQAHAVEMVGILFEFMLSSVQQLRPPLSSNTPASPISQRRMADVVNINGISVNVRVFKTLWVLFKEHYLSVFFPDLFEQLQIATELDRGGFTRHSVFPLLQQLLVDRFVAWHTDISPNAAAIRVVLHSCREDSEIVLENFRQAFLVPVSCSSTMSCTIEVYKLWLRAKHDEMPLFMREPAQGLSNQRGLQETMQRMMKNVVVVFSAETSRVLLEQHFVVCMEVLSLFQLFSVEQNNVILSPDTWDHLLSSLISICTTALVNPPSSRLSLSARLAPTVIEALLVTWVRAQRRYYATASMWNNLQSFLSSLASTCPEVVDHWTSIMVELSFILCRSVYAVDLDALPLDSLSSKSVRQRFAGGGGGSGASPAPSDSNRAASLGAHDVRKNVGGLPKNTQSVAELLPVNNSRSSVVVPLGDSRLRFPPSGLEVDLYRQFFQVRLLDWKRRVAMFVWKNMLCALGNINAITEPKSHLVAIRGLERIHGFLCTVRVNQGISIDNMSTPPPPDHFPPLFAFSTWLFEATTLPDTFKESRAVAYGLLCRSIVRRHDTPVKTEYLNNFYRVVHAGLSSVNRDEEIVRQIVHNANDMFRHCFAGASVLMNDWLDAVRFLLHTSSLKEVPIRQLAITSLCSLVAFATVHTNQDVPLLTTLASGEIKLERVPYGTLQRNIIDEMCTVATDESFRETRCLGICGVCVSVYHILVNGLRANIGARDIESYLDVLLGLIRNDEQTTAMMAVSMIDLLSEESVRLAAIDPLLVEKVVEKVTSMVLQCLNQAQKKETMVTQLLFCLMDWLMVDGSEVLHNRELGLVVFNVLFYASEGYIPLDDITEAALDNIGMVCDETVSLQQQQLQLSPSLSQTNNVVPSTPQQQAHDVAPSLAPSTSATSGATPSAPSNVGTPHFHSTHSHLVSSPNATSSPGVLRGATNVVRMFEPAVLSSKLADLFASAESTVRGAFKRNHKSHHGAGGATRRSEHTIRTTSHDAEPTVVAARTVLNHLLHHHHCFPGVAGVARISSHVSEFNDLPSQQLPPDQRDQRLPQEGDDASVAGDDSFVPLDDLLPSLFESPNVEFFVVGTTTILSMVEVPSPSGEGTCARIIVRDLTGKYAWDSSIVFDEATFDSGHDQPDFVGVLDRLVVGDEIDAVIASEAASDPTERTDGVNAVGGASTSSVEKVESRAQSQSDLVETTSSGASPTKRRQSIEYVYAAALGDGGSGAITVDHVFQLEPTEQQLKMTKVSPLDVPLWREGAYEEGTDCVSQALAYIGGSADECLFFDNVPINVPLPAPAGTELAEANVAAALIDQSKCEDLYHQQCLESPTLSMITLPARPKNIPDPISSFHKCRLMLSHLGLLSWENRKHVHMLEKSEQMLRLLKQLDKKAGVRDYHKIGVLYVAPGQEDEHSILSNEGGSRAYENFLAGLGWEVELRSHAGFDGQLIDGKNGHTTPYYATSTMEVIYHVATRMPSGPDNKAAVLNKKKHIGNDRVQVVWTEHTRDYRPDIIRSRFNDAIIVISPMSNGLFHIAITRKPEVPMFGPLFDGAIVDGHSLAPLVRATAVNANRAVLGTVDGWKRYFAQRHGYMEDVINRHSLPSAMEDFLLLVVKPADPPGVQRYMSTVASPAPPTPARAPVINTSHSSKQPTNKRRPRSRAPKSCSFIEEVIAEEDDPLATTAATRSDASSPATTATPPSPPDEVSLTPDFSGPPESTC